MYSSSEYSAYGQKQRPTSGQNLAPDGASQLSMASRHSALLGGAHYGGQYASLYDSTAHNSALQAPATSDKGAGSSVLEAVLVGRYGSTMQDTPKYTSGDYTAASLKYGQKGEKMFSDVRLPYADRDLQNESTARFADSIAFRHHQTDIYDRLDAAAALRQELLQCRSLQPASVDGSSRQADYLAARAATVRHPGQEILPYGGRIDADLHTLSMISGTQHAPSILGAASRREVEDLLYTYSSANPGYGVSLPPGRDYVSGKSLHRTSLESAYPDGVLAHASYSRLDDCTDDMAYAWEIERREEDRRREILREQERDHDRERERERERERRREREIILERPEKEREREIRRERSPIRISRDRGRSTSAARGRSSRRESFRRHSRVKEQQREYSCKVYSSNLVDTERDYLSMDKRYSGLFVSSECSKVIVNWSKEDLNIPLNTPISFEHDFVQEETRSEHESASTKTVTNGQANLGCGTTRWNAKMLLMSGLSRNAWEELLSERKYEDRIPHLCNMLRFAFLKNGNSLMAIGGLWDTVDGNDPSVNKSTLIQTVSRYAKELTGLDLKNCRNWNPFLEIHYDRIGKDGFFSHKEITVLYIPDLSDCLPSIDAWRDQWLAHKKDVAEREHLHSLKREKSRKKKEVSKDKEPKTNTDLKNVEKLEKAKEAGSAAKVNGNGKVGTPVKAEKAGKEGDKIVIEKKDEDNTITEKKDVEMVDLGNNSEKKNQTDNAFGVQTPGSGKKVMRKVIHKKSVLEKDGAENAPKQNDTNTEVTSADTGSSGTPLTAKTSTKKKATKKSPVVKTVKKEDELKEPECSDDKTKNEDVVVKTTAKKKIIKKVTKKNIAAKDANIRDKMVKGNEAGLTVDEVKSENNENVPQDVGGSAEIGNKSEKIRVTQAKKAKVEGRSDKNEKLKGGKEKKDTRGKEVKDKKKVEEPPRHPGLILQTKGDKNSKLRSLSLSLDSLLDYTDKDIEESTFELSLFAETFYEMLQYQMGSRILTFLQKLRIKVMAKRNQKKRQREEASDKKEKEKTKKSSAKHQKTDDVTVESRSVKTETLQEDEKDMVIDNVDNTKKEDESGKDDSEEEPEEDLEEEPEEDPEKDPEEDEHMADAIPKSDAENEEKAEVDRVDMNMKSEKKDEKVKSEPEDDFKVTVNLEKKENSKVDKKKKKETLPTIDKELLQAFRFFDRNRVGYIRVEDLRLILHSLGKCKSHRDVKELVQSALLESNTGRDDQILYNKLVKMTSWGEDQGSNPGMG